jgi:predicted RNA methylase
VSEHPRDSYARQRSLLLPTCLRRYRTCQSGTGECVHQGLASGIERIDNQVLDAWAFRLARLSLIGTDRQAFGWWLNEQLADAAAQTPESGQYTTPPSIAQLMVQLASFPNDASVLDPCCGIGGLLSAAVEWSRENHSTVSVFGQELLPVNWALCRLRLFGLGQNAGSIALGDSLRQPAFAENLRLKMFDCVLCDPPLGLTLHEPDLALRDSYERFIYSAPARGHADSAFVQHAVASTKPNGNPANPAASSIHCPTNCRVYPIPLAPQKFNWRRLRQIPAQSPIRMLPSNRTSHLSLKLSHGLETKALWVGDIEVEIKRPGATPSSLQNDY